MANRQDFAKDWATNLFVQFLFAFLHLFCTVYLLAAFISECVIRYDDDVPEKCVAILSKCGSLCGACLTAIIWLMMSIKLNLLAN